MKLLERTARGILRRYSDGEISKSEAEMRLRIIRLVPSNIEALLDDAEPMLDTVGWNE